jgi:hypothetical protein
MKDSLWWVAVRIGATALDTFSQAIDIMGSESTTTGINGFKVMIALL